MTICMICGNAAEVRYVPGVVVKFPGEKHEREFVGTEAPEGATLIRHTEVRRVFCACNDGQGRHP